MTGYQIFLLLFYTVSCLHLGHAVPIADGIDEIPHQMGSLPGFAVFLISGAAILLLGYVVIGCVCCPNHNIKALSYQNGFPVSRLNENSLQFENPSEFAIFPPHSAVIDLQPVGLPYPTFEDKVTFEPLPDILPRKLSGQSPACSSRPAHFRALLKNKISLHDWFEDPNSNFPRDQLQYIQELGCGWFGRVVEGEASHINNSEEKKPVLVKILREEASPSEHLHFLHEVRPYRDLVHPNIVRLLGRCLESDPFLIIMEHSISDLKTFLVQHENKESFLKDGIPLQMACGVAAGLKCLHENGFTHMDLAAHNCFVCKDFTVKVGDYGISFDKCREDYYCLGGIALPIRWCSPETLLCTDATIETKEITKEANVWAFGIILWEIFELGELPYEELTNEEVLQKVLIEKTVQLSAPSREFPFKEELYLIMKECWKPAHLRPSIEKAENFLARLYNDRHNLKTMETSFEERWNSLPPKAVDSKLLGTELVPLKFENDFSEKSDSHNYSSDGERFSSFEMSYDMYSKSIGSHLSPSLRVLNGSIDELTENDVCLNSVSLCCEKSATDAASVDSDVPQLEDDQGNHIRDYATSDTVKDLDLGLPNLSDTSKQPQKLQLTGKKNVNPFVIEDCTQPLHKCADSKADCDAKVCYNLNMLKTLDDNSNELVSDSEDLKNFHASKYVETEAMSIENSPDAVNANQVLDFCAENPDILEEINVVSCPEAFSNSGVQTNSSNLLNYGLSPVPDIVIHESASVVDSSHDENENILQDGSNGVSTSSESARPFRFVFKDESVPAIDVKSTVKSSEGASGSQDTPNATDSSLENFPVNLKSQARSECLTSTPVKNDLTNLNYSSSFADDEDSGNVFYDENGSSVAEEYFSGSCELLESISASQVRNLKTIGDKNSKESFYVEAVSAFETSVEIEPNPTDVKENTGSNDFVSALSTFDENSPDFCDIVASKNNSTVTVSNNQAVVINKSLPTFNSELNGHESSIMESKHLDASEIEFQKPELFPEKNTSLKLDSMNSEDVPSYDFCEPVTPELSFNVSSCSYGNDFKSISTDSPVISSTNKDLEYDSPIKKYCPNMQLEVEPAVTPECLANDVEYHKHTDLLDSGTTQDFRTLDSEASGSEYLESISPDVTPDSFGHSDEKRMVSIDNMRPVKSNFKSSLQSASTLSKTDLLFDDDDLENDSESDTNAYKSKSELRLHPYDEVIVEDLETGEQTIITESFSACDDYDNSADSDEILKINIETDEAIIVDSSEALIGFVPSRSIELLQECEIIPTLNPSFAVEDEKESSDSNHFDATNSASSSPVAMQSTNSPCKSPESAYPLHQPYRNFSLQNEVIEEEITDEITTPSSIHSSASFSSNEGFGEEEKMSQSSESFNREVYETSVLPSVDHFYDESNDGSRSDVSDSDCSPVHSESDMLNNIHYVKDYENNQVSKGLHDVMLSKQPIQSVCWHSDETLDIERDSPVILEGREILAGGTLQTRGMSVKDITATFNQLDADDCLNRQTINHLSVSHSPSPYSSLESSPCREAYTPDFESDSDDGGTSCSSTSGSFECIHNKFKDTTDISKLADETEPSDSSREQSPKKIFSKTWDCHATPSKSVLITPEKKFNSLRKSVSFHEEDPQVVFEYPPASDSSEDGQTQEEIRNSRDIDYRNFADWELHAGESEEPEIEEVLEIEELESEPYVRRPAYGIGASLGPMNRPMYSFTSGFSDDDMDINEPLAFPSKSVAPSNSPEEGKHPSLSGDQISELIKNQLNNLALEESRLKWMQDELDQQSHEFSYINSTPDRFLTSVHPSEGDSVPVSEQDVLIDELLPENATVRKEVLDSELRNQATSMHTTPTEKQMDYCLISLDINEEMELTHEFNFEDTNVNNVSIASTEPTVKNSIDFDIEGNDGMLINFDDGNQSDFSKINATKKCLSEEDVLSFENNLLIIDSSNFVDQVGSSGMQNLPFQSNELFPTLPVSDSNLLNSIQLGTSTSSIKLDDCFVPEKNICAHDGEEEAQPRFEAKSLKFIQANNYDLDSLPNDSLNKQSIDQVSDPSHTYSNLSENTRYMNSTLETNLEKFVQGEIKERGSNGEQNLKTELIVGVDDSRSETVLNSDSVLCSEILGNSLDNNVNAKTNEGTETSDVLDELNENVVLGSEKIQIETENDTSLHLINIMSDDCISLSESSTKKHIDNALERNLDDPGDDSVVLNNRVVGSFLPETKVSAESFSDNILLQEKVVNATSSCLNMENTEIFKVILDENCVDNSRDLFTSETVNETGDNIYPTHISNRLPDTENKIQVSDCEQTEVVESESSDFKKSSSDGQIYSKKEKFHENDANLPASKSELDTESALSCTHLTKTLEATSKKPEIKKELLEPLPQIIVTPASESEVEDELEEYLRDQLEFFHGPSVTGGEDFSVTSQFSIRPFEDVFGSHGASHNSGDYIEAFNFEFDSGDFFEDFIDDYPTGISNRRLPVGDGNYQWWESPDAPPMIEKSSEEDDLTSKPETSPLYSLKDATHL